MVSVSESTFSQWLRNLREDRSVSLRIVAAAVDMDSTLLSKLEVGGRLPTDKQAAALASYYGIPISDMRHRLVAARIMDQFGDDPALTHAISIVREEAGAAKPPLPPRKPVTYSTARQRKK
jgi:HTH-type transcriptional regulator, competence development regulator